MSVLLPRLIRTGRWIFYPPISTKKCRLCRIGNVFLYSSHVAIYRCFFSLPGSTKEYSEKKVIGYSMEQFYNIVANVDDYKNFVPWCVASKTFQKTETYARANLEVGFPPVSEKYTSVLTLARPNLVKSECMDGTLFNHLTCIWRISQGPRDIPNSCTLNFYISFEFKSLLHSQLSSMFFDEVVRKMVAAFESRAKILHGPSSLENTRLDKRRKRRGRSHVNNNRPVIARNGR